MVDQISPGISQSDWQLGAEVQVENKIARRCSYEEMVHEDPDDHDLGMNFTEFFLRKSKNVQTKKLVNQINQFHEKFF